MYTSISDKCAEDSLGTFNSVCGKAWHDELKHIINGYNERAKKINVNPTAELDLSDPHVSRKFSHEQVKVMKSCAIKLAGAGYEYIIHCTNGQINVRYGSTLGVLFLDEIEQKGYDLHEETRRVHRRAGSGMFSNFHSDLTTSRECDASCDK